MSTPIPIFISIPKLQKKEEMPNGGVTEEKESELVAQLRSAVSDVFNDSSSSGDRYLLRWLRARNYDVLKAEKMLRDLQNEEKLECVSELNHSRSLIWRKQIGADDLADSYKPPEALSKYYPIGMVGHDKTGCPVWVVPFGCCDLKGLMQSAKKSDYVKYSVHLVEKSILDMKQQSDKLQHPVEQHVVIFDLENFGMKHIAWKPGIDLMVHMANIFGDNYPEILKKIYVVNTPKVFEVAYAIVKPFINEVTIRKIQMFGRDNWQDSIVQEVEASELPVQWGGTKIDGSGDPRCPSLVCCGGDVPQSYYMAPANRLSESANVQNVVVNKGSKMWLEKEVTEAGSMLKWEFKTESNDIGFGVYCENEGGELQELLPSQRVNCHLVPEDGQLICSQPGIYKICFDNSFSRLRSKKLSYVLDVV